MSDDKKTLLIAVAGAVLGAVLTSLYYRSHHKDETTEEASGITVKSTPTSISIKHEETKSAPVEIKKSTSFSKNKVVNLRRGSGMCTDGFVISHDVAVFPVPHLGEIHKANYTTSPLLGDLSKRDILGENKNAGFIPEKSFSSAKKFIVTGKAYSSIEDIHNSLKFLRAGPRKELFFDPKEVKAAIVTCGGLCPGLNVVIREIVMSLWYNYGVKSIYGIKWGYRGFHKAEHIIELNPGVVKAIHRLGGTFLGSSRGGFDEEIIMNACLERGINQLYIIGGDGTHRGIYRLYEYATEKKYKISI